MWQYQVTQKIKTVDKASDWFIVNLATVNFVEIGN